MTKDTPNDDAQGEKKPAAKKRAKTTKFRKAPQAPKRFKSAFIFFSCEKHPEIRQSMKEGKNTDVPNVAKLVSEAWRNLSPQERAIWEKKAEDDKKRYEMERTMYTGPWKIPASKRAKKDPDAPKRPMSAFLAYSKKMRSQVKQENPHLSNTEVSKLLATKWKDAPQDEREVFIKNEAEEREVYKVAISEWRATQEEKLEAQRKQREQIAQMAMQPNAQLPGYPSNGYGYGPPTEMNAPMSSGPPPQSVQYNAAAYAQGNQRGHEYSWPNRVPDGQHAATTPASVPSGGNYWGDNRGVPPYSPHEGQSYSTNDGYSDQRAGYAAPDGQSYYNSHTDSSYAGNYQQAPPAYNASYPGPGGHQHMNHAVPNTTAAAYPSSTDRYAPDQPASASYSDQQHYNNEGKNSGEPIRSQSTSHYPQQFNERYDGQYYGNGPYDYS